MIKAYPEIDDLEPLKSNDQFGNIFDHINKLYDGVIDEIINDESNNRAYLSALYLVRFNSGKSNGVIECPDVRILEFLFQDPYLTSRVAFHAKSRWLEAEKFIIRDPRSASIYALDVIGHRWKEAERVIFTSRSWGYWYLRTFSHEFWFLRLLSPLIDKIPTKIKKSIDSYLKPPRQYGYQDYQFYRILA